jgi:hypothetical protein
MKPTVGIMLYGSGGQLRDALTEESYRLLARQFIEQGWALHTLTYHDTRREVVRSEARACDAVLVWINPIEPGLDRLLLDSFLGELSASGVLVSALHGVIQKIGTKDVLVETQRIGWSIDARMYRSFAEFKGRFPGLVRRDGIRVLKQHRGNSGQGVWKVSLLSGDYVVQPATRGTPAQTMNEPALMGFFQSQVFARGSHLVDQAWVPTLPRGMVRAYLCGSKVAGFGYQEINALYPVQPEDDFTRRQPSRRHYYTAECHLFQPLRLRLEQDWLPALQAHFGIQPHELPLIWDADFLFGNSDEYLLCEINASCVSPFPESAITPMIAELARRLGDRNAALAGL